MIFKKKAGIKINNKINTNPTINKYNKTILRLDLKKQFIDLKYSLIFILY